MGRVGALAALVLGLVALGEAPAQTVRKASDERPNIVDVGDPILISRQALSREMALNTDLRDWVKLYGLPDYAEVQEIEIDTPFAPYEVRLYYLQGNMYLAFGRVHVAPSLYDYGVRKFVSRIRPQDLDRLLTARSEPVVGAGPAAAAGMWTVETTAVDAKPLGH